MCCSPIQVEVLKPIPHVKKIKETRYTTIRYPVFITQVIKPLLTQVETKVKPVFFTKTIDKYTTVLFTVTGIGQVTVTSVKYEKEYITRCMKKKPGYGHGGGGGHHKGGGGHKGGHKGGGGYHRRDYGDDEGPYAREEGIPLPLEPSGVLQRSEPSGIAPPPGIPYDAIAPPPGIPYDPIADDRSPIHLQPGPSPRIPGGHRERISPRNRGPSRRPRPRRPGPRRPVNRKGAPAEQQSRKRPYKGQIGDPEELYSQDVYYMTSRKGESGPTRREAKDLILEPSSTAPETIASDVHPVLETQPLVILT